MKIKLIGVDLAKNVFQVCALNQANKVLFNRAVRRPQLRKTIAQLPPSILAMESCSSAHYWAGHSKPWGIRWCWCQHSTSSRLSVVARVTPAMRLPSAKRPSDPVCTPVPIKSVAQQDILLLHRLRQGQVQLSTALANQIRSLGREYGVVFAYRRANPHRPITCGA